MSRKKTTPPPSKIPPGVRRESGMLVCDVCRFTIPYQGYLDPTLDERPKHRCRSEIRAFDRFDTAVPKQRFMPPG